MAHTQMLLRPRLDSAARTLHAALAPLVLQRRGLAVPINPATSVDHMLGTAMPAAPVAKSDDRGARRTLNDAHDASELNRMVNSDTDANGDIASRRAEMERLRSTATGASRRGTAIPDADRLLTQSLDSAQLRWNEEATIMPTVPRSSPEIGTEQDRGALEHYAITAARVLAKQSALDVHVAQLRDLHADVTEKANVQLSVELPYEPAPRSERRVEVTSAVSSPEELQQCADDGVLLLCYIDGVGTGNERVSMSSGFAVQGGDALAPGEGAGKGSLVVSCAHTLQSAYTPSQGHADSSGTMFAITRLGYIFPVRTLVSSLPDADIALFQLDERPLLLDAVSNTLERVDRPLRTLPVSPYPAVLHSELSISSFGGWLSASCESNKIAAFPRLTDNQVIRNRWARATLVGYKDPIGRVAETGTYDELAQLSFTLNDQAPETPESLRRASLKRSKMSFPLPGSSGGPVVDINSGSVVGIVRGHRTSQLHGSRGDAVPAEKVFELFALPGLGNRR
ncbi:hypothetical protein MVES1_000842 [Malassezia vespertilionis]|uniref:uncharacterized protein n=1 Tax=Malassezia vespertilionis TaxID=2020962 RepID=UPI0024B22467|nr:uncharacterized protein MVES1_000842 [Malassezia vespertilionis]WFD05512.1 hypothetical protein MVES1_000842 [Malassezia vespertilionis]